MEHLPKNVEVVTISENAPTSHPTTDRLPS